MMSYEPSIKLNQQQFHPVPQAPALPPKPMPEPALNYEHG
jgi:hypothetical protein